MKRTIKLINSERSTPYVNSKKATVCEEGSYDYCVYIDEANCTGLSYDVCNKDNAACYEAGYDYCTNYRDTDACGASRDYN